MSDYVATWRPNTANTERELHDLCEEVKQNKNYSLPDKAKLCFLSSLQPKVTVSLSQMQKEMLRIQKFISSFEYNFTKEKFTKFKKKAVMKKVVRIAKEVIRSSLPIRCVEATFMAAYLTTGLDGVTRFPVHFRSKFKNIVYKHLVLFIEYKGRFGALGLSRKEDLMYKPLSHNSLSSIILAFKKCYENNQHELHLVGIGLPFSHDYWSFSPIRWQVLHLSFNDTVTNIDYILSAFWSDIKLLRSHIAENKMEEKRKLIQTLITKFQHKKSTRLN